VEYSGGKWYLHNFHDANDWYIGDVGAMERTPEPAALSLLALGAVGLLSRRPKLRKTRP